MEDNSKKRSKWLHLRLTEEEYKVLKQAFNKTTEKQLSVYARKVFLGTPVIKGYRNLTLDQLMVEFIKLNKTINGVANNYNQSIHKLHTFDHFPQVRQWLEKDGDKGSELLVCIQEIRLLLKKMADHGSRH